MSSRPVMPVTAIVSDAERAGIAAAGQQLAEALSAGSGVAWQVRLHFASFEDGDIPPEAAIVTSLHHDVDGAEPVDRIAERWQARIRRHRAAGHGRILLCNLFRHVQEPSPAGITIERLRRLNQLAINLSRTAGIEIVDVDRLLALFGARAIETDYRCDSAAARRLVGHAIAAAILDGDLGGRVDDAAQGRASDAHGGVRDIRRLTERHFQLRQAS